MPESAAPPLSEDTRPEACYAAPLLVYIGSANECLDGLSDIDLGTWLIEQTLRLNEALLEHHRAWLRSGNRLRADTYRKTQHLTFTNYGEVYGGIPVNWMLGSEGQANLSWQLHSFFFLRDFVASHQLTKDGGYLATSDALLVSWAREALVQQPKPRFAWNDHSTAYRLHALTHYYVYLRGFDAPPKERLAELYRLIVRHQAVLLSRHLYSRGTNHGLDQAFYLYVSTAVIPEHSESRKVREIALQRLRYELLRSFAEDGVHIENSPEYHDLVLNSVSYMSHIAAVVEGDIGALNELNTRLAEGIRFLAYVIRPDGLLPTIGDSTQIQPRSAHPRMASAPAYQAFLHARSRGSEGNDTPPDCAIFPASGYAILRGPRTEPLSRRMHTIFKCGFLSTYHRHDDDNGIVLYAGGEDWLIDAGLYKHEERDPQRVYMRSARAHCLMLPVGIDASRDIKRVQAQLIRHEINKDRVSVCGSTSMFPGFRYERAVVFEPKHRLQFTDTFIRNVATDNRAQHYELLLHLPGDKRIDASGTTIRVESINSSAEMRIHLDPRGLLSIMLLRPTEGQLRCRRSIAYDQLEDTQTIQVTYCGQPDLSVTTHLDLTGLL